MKRLLILALFAFVLWPHAANSTTCSVPSTFVNGTTADANAVNANFSSLVACSNAIDNTNIGSSGIYASQIKPTNTTQATFGGTIGYVMNPNTNGIVPLTLSNAASPAADYLDIVNSVSTKLFFVDSSGNTNTGQIISNADVVANAAVTPNPAVTGANGEVAVAQATAAPTAQPGNINVSGSTIANKVCSGGLTSICGTAAVGALVSALSGTTGVVYLMGGGNTRFLFYDGTEYILNGAPLEAGTTSGYVAPVYTSAGAITASTLHAVLGTCAFAATTSCVVTLTGAAVFSSNTSFSCGVMDRANSIAASFVWAIIPLTSSGNTFTLESNNSNSDTMLYQCLGT